MLGTLSFFFAEGLGKFHKVPCQTEWFSAVLHTLLNFMLNMVRSSYSLGLEGQLGHKFRGRRGGWLGRKKYPKP